MKKVLFGTTALVAAAFVGQAAVAKSVKLKVGGYYNAGFGVGPITAGSTVGNNSIATGVAGAATNVDKDFHIINDGEIQFKGKGTLDNGVKIEVRVEIEAYGDASDYVDEHYIKVKTSLGDILIGQNDTALDNVAGKIGLSPNGGIAGGAWDRDYTFVPGATGNHLGDEGDDYSIQYYTPNLSGFVFGVSWAPSESTDGNQPGDGIDTNADATNSNDLFSIGGRYSNWFDNDVYVKVGGGYFQKSSDFQATINGELDTTAWGGGLEIGFEKNASKKPTFLIGGAVHVRETERGVAGVILDNEQTQYGLGAQYATGPWMFGVSGYFSETDDDAVGEDFETMVLNAAVDYKLGNGVHLGLGIDYGDIDFDANGLADEDAVGGLLLLGVKF